MTLASFPKVLTQIFGVYLFCWIPVSMTLIPAISVTQCVHRSLASQCSVTRACSSFGRSAYRGYARDSDSSIKHLRKLSISTLARRLPPQYVKDTSSTGT
ncbi:hypothetical protein EDD85DRAFT_816560 [Armillaria nabsnona]|nr:hypothetical protein EDD85DRAFT_816560 [Armillaria nabsnona]